MRPYDWRDMLTEAREMLGGGKRLRENKPKEDGGFECFPIPSIVLKALASEIALKALLHKHRVIDGPTALAAVLKLHDLPPSKHNLSSLFSLLPQATQDAFRVELESRLPKAQMVHFIPPRSVEVTGFFEMKVTSMHGTLQERIAMVARAFEGWRYAYEFDQVEQINETFLEAFAETAIYLLASPK